MALLSKRIGLGTLGLLAGFGAPRLAAQAWAVSASDPVGIARSGAGVAYGQSLEAASLNPALLSSLKDRTSVFVGVGQELQITQTSLQTSQVVEASSDRNRALPSFGAAWRLSDKLVLGLKLDEPFMRHVDMPLDATSRFQGTSMDLTTHRLEAQGAWALSPNWSFGGSLGVTQIHYAWSNMVRFPVSANPDPSVPVSASNPALALMEVGLQQEATKSVPSYSLGFRWAINSRWTVGGTYVGAMSTTMPLAAGFSPAQAAYYDNYTGYGPAISGSSAYGPGVQALSSVQPGSGKLTLPGKATLGIRQRVNQQFTWELDFRYVEGSATTLPGYPTLTGPSGTFQGSGMSENFCGGYGASLMGELAFWKTWTARMGVSQDANLRSNVNVDPMVGGAKNFTVSAGFSHRMSFGELNFGYQFRQAQDVNSNSLDYKWNQNGLQQSGVTTRVEGMGHLWSIGFKKAF